MKILALCGSLRKQSRSLALLQAVSLLAPKGMEFSIYNGLGELPLFNPDIEPPLPVSVRDYWFAVSGADAIIIASPEYAHGITGTMKNALDWLVGFPPFVAKPVAVLNPSHRAEHADLALREVLRTMNADLILPASLRIPATANNLNGLDLARCDSFVEPILMALASIEIHLANPTLIE